VQHLVAAQKERVWSLIEQGAIIYVCGDGGKMEPDVKAALVAIYRERTGGDATRGCAGSTISAPRTATCWATSLRAKANTWAGGTSRHALSGSLSRASPFVAAKA
jgi:hypothetical protein